MTAGSFYPTPEFSFPYTYTLGQNFEILNNFMAGNYSLVTVNLGYSTNTDVEREILKVAGYGRQLGRIGDALAVLVKHLEPKLELNEEDAKALFALKSLLFEISQAKKAALASSKD